MPAIGAARVRENLWLLAGWFGGAFWFLRSLGFPSPYSGRDCGTCDADGYVQLARQGRLLEILFSAEGYRRGGYPFFLAAHRWFLESLGLETVVDWVVLALWSGFLLYEACAVYFYRSMKAIGLEPHPSALLLLLAYPGLTASAAVPLTDTMTTALTMLAVSMAARCLHSGSSPSLRLAVGGGAALGFAMLLRPTVQPAVLILLAGWLAISALRAKSTSSEARPIRLRLAVLATPVLAAAMAGGVLLPRAWNCTARYGSYCIDPPVSMGGASLTPSLYMGLRWPRIFTGFQLDGLGHFERARLMGVVDPLYADRYGERCPISEESQFAGLLGCYAKNVTTLPVYQIKKVVALFDTFSLSAYTTEVTTQFDLLFSRAFGALAFGGFMISVFFAVRAVLIGQCSSAWFVPLLFSVSYIGYSTVASVEARYGFIAVPSSLAALTIALQHLQKDRRGLRIGKIAALSGLMLVFVVQTHAWDEIPPMELRSPAVLLEQSLAAFQAGRYGDCMEAALQAAQLDPRNAAAFSRAGRCAGALRLWDNAIRYTQKAIRLAPHPELEANNLVWLQQQRASAMAAGQSGRSK